MIGVTSFVEDVRWGHWNAPAALTPFVYVRAVANAGGRAVQLPPDADAVDETLDRLDGLVATGGIDVDPALYGGEAASDDGRRPARSRTRPSSRCSRRALERDLPVLAICRGSQLLNVLRGGDIVQDLATDERLGGTARRRDGRRPRTTRFASGMAPASPG